MPGDKRAQSDFALFNLGFRPFFLGAAIYSVIVVGAWTAIFALNINLPISGLSVFQWHAHEMLFGYTLAVIAGFLLTAVKNWTGMQTLHGPMLAVLFGLWLVARLLFLTGTSFMQAAALFDLLFVSVLIVSISYPIIKTRNWRQLGILSKLVLLAAANACFYLGYFGMLEQGMYLGIYGGLYLVIGLVLTMGSRVIPFFIERGVGYPVTLSNPMWSTVTGVILFLIFFISELFLQNQMITAYAAIGLFILYLVRLAGWHTKGIWHKPLLWSLYIAFGLITIGFLLFALSVFTGLSKYLAIHLFAYGGIGLITMSMMARVSIGHTGRNINEPPRLLNYIFIIFLLGVVARVFVPMFDIQNYPVWVVVSQLLWILAFLLFSFTFFSILTRKRVDGKYG